MVPNKTAPVTHDPANPMMQRALRAVARQRLMGLHFIGHFIGVEGLPDDEEVAAHLQLPAREPYGTRPVSDLELGVLVDVAMGHAVRQRLTQGMRLATTTLAIHRAPRAVVRPVVATPVVQWLDTAGGAAAVRFEVTDTTGLVAACGSAAFALLPSPSRRNVAPMNWSLLDGIEDVDPDTLDPQERAAVEAAEATGADSGTDVLNGLLGVQWEDVDNGTLHGVLNVGPQHENRVGHLQGGVAYAVGALAAQNVVGGRRPVLDGHMSYLRPTSHGPLVITATIVRNGTKLAFIRVNLVSAGKLTTDMSFTMGAEES